MKKVSSNFHFSFLIICILFVFSACKTEIEEEITPIINAEPPIITTHPISARAIVPATCTFTTGAYTKDNGTLTFQWYCIPDANDEASSEKIEEATNSSLSTKMNTPSKIGYYCKITNTIEDNGDGGSKTASITTEIAWFETVNLSDVLECPVFTEQPHTTCVLKGEGAKFSCNASIDNYNIVYRWFETDSTGENKIPLSSGWSSSSDFETSPFTDYEIKYYICAASPYIPNDDSVPEKAVFSNIVAAAYTGLPILYLNTEVATSDITRDSYVLGDLKLITENETKEYTFSKKKEGIKGRGNYSWSGTDKKGYNIKFDTPQSFFGLPESKKWCIISNYFDHTFMHNKFASILGTEIYNTGWNSTFNYVDVIINKEYRGQYILCEKIAIEENKINIQDISDYTTKKIANGKYIDKNNDNKTDLYDGGFLLEIDFRGDADFAFRTERKLLVTLKEPDEITDDEIKKHIKKIVQDTEDALYSDDFSNTEEIDGRPISNWMKNMNIDSVIDWYIVNEFLTNYDSPFITSVYMYYDPSTGQLNMGPNWDFDGLVKKESGWFTRYLRNDAQGTLMPINWITRMSEDPLFTEYLKTRWNEKRDALKVAINQLQSLADEIETSALYDYSIWHPGLKYDEKVNNLINWLNIRYEWIDSELNSL